MTTKPLMACGHAANGYVKRDGVDVDVCVICYGIGGDDAITPVEPPDLTGRTASCSSCGATAPSSTSLPFFRHYPERETDSYYSGCRGWD